MWRRLLNAVPAAAWLGGYNSATFKADLVAGTAPHSRQIWSPAQW